MSRIRLTWNNASTTIVEQRVYRSISPLDFDDMPDPLAVLPRRSREYLDSTIEDGLAYYYAVSSVLPDYSELISEEIKVEATSSDPHWDNVVALLHFDGDLHDEAGRVWTGSGAFSYVGGKFGLGFKSSGGWVSTPASPDLNLSTGDFTIECFMDLTGTSGLRALLSSGVQGWGAGNIYILVDGMNRLEIGSFEAGHIWISSATLPSSGTFHFCLERLAGELRLLVEGVLVDSKLSGAALNFSTSGTRIGVNSTAGNPFSGVIDELRITKGVARYIENFDPPTKPFPNN